MGNWDDTLFELEVAIGRLETSLKRLDKTLDEIIERAKPSSPAKTDNKEN